MPSLGTLKLIGGLVAALFILSLVADRGRWMHRAHVAEAFHAADCQAARTASGLKKLRCDETAAQIGFLGEALNAVKAKTEAARASDAANKTRVEGEQSAISQERGSSYEARIADARARAAERVRRPAPAANPGRGGTAPVSGLPAPAGGTTEGSGQDGLSDSDRLIATEQAIQLDELIKWVKAQHVIDVNGPQASPQPH
jgi:hypothetical protein